MTDSQIVDLYWNRHGNAVEKPSGTEADLSLGCLRIYPGTADSVFGLAV